MTSFRFLSILVIFVLAVSVSGCLDSEEPFDAHAQLQKEIKAIDEHLAANSLTAVKDPSGVRMVITELGTGLPAIQTNRIKVDYEGRVLGSSAPFDEGTADQLLGNYIPGWIVAFSTLPQGSKATIFIPSYLAYGNQQQGSIPPSSTLVFDVNFIDIVESETEKTKFKSDTTAIETYLTGSEILDVTTDASGLRYKITEEGNGSVPSWYDGVKINLVYKLLSNPTTTVLTRSYEPTESSPSRVVDFINGIKVGLQKMPEGSKATFYIPSGLAFGPAPVTDNGSVVIPANSNLIVEVELIDVR